MSERALARWQNFCEQANRHYETNVVKLMTCNLFVQHWATLVILFIRLQLEWEQSSKSKRERERKKRVWKAGNVINYAKYLHTAHTHRIESIVLDSIEQFSQQSSTPIDRESTFNRCPRFFRISCWSCNKFKRTKKLFKLVARFDLVSFFFSFHFSLSLSLPSFSLYSST